MSYITEESDSGSEYCETMDIADAELFANDNFRDYLLEFQQTINNITGI